MLDVSKWDWQPGERKIAEPGAWSEKFEWVEELTASPDGEKIAAVVCAEAGEFTACVNGETWEETFERIWGLKFGPDGRLAGLCQSMGEWTMGVDGETWPENYAYIWGTKFGPQGSIAAAVQQDGQYAMGVEGELWETTYDNANHFTLAPNGKSTCAVVQVKALGQADVEGFLEGVFSVAVNGKAWDRNFVNCWTPVFDANSAKVACQVRLTPYDYTIAVDGKPWSKTFGCVWEPLFSQADGSVIAPVRQGGKWGLAKNGEILWQPVYFQLWHTQTNMSGDIYAIGAPTYGDFTVIANDKPWNDLFPTVIDLSVSPDGKRASAIGKKDYDYTLLVDNAVVAGPCPMIWKAVFSPDSKHYAAKVEMPGKKYTIIVNGKLYDRTFDQVFDPVFCPDSGKVLIRGVDGGTFVRIVAPVSEF